MSTGLSFFEKIYSSLVEKIIKPIDKNIRLLINNISNNNDYKETLIKGLFIFIILIIIIILSIVYIPNYSGLTLNILIFVSVISCLAGIIYFLTSMFEVIKKNNISISNILLIFLSLFSLSGFGFTIFLIITYLIPQFTGISLALIIFILLFFYLFIFIYILVSFFNIFNNETFSLVNFLKYVGIGFISGIAIIALVFGIMFVFSFFSSHLLVLKVIIGLITLLLLTKLISKIPKIDKISNLLINTILYLPCLINFSLDNIIGEQSYFWLLIILEIILILLYIFYPNINSLIYTKGGMQIINKPVKLYELNTLSSSQKLNGSDSSTYNYAISLWVYLDSVPPSVNNSYTKEGNILSLGKTPSIRYKSINNSIIVSVENEKGATGEKIIATIPDVQLQKWNQIIINYTAGTMDVFYNSKLISSTMEVVSYQNFDLLQVGEDNGISGGLANLIYYKEPLDIYKIKHLYNSLKSKSPPSLNFPNKTIIQI